MSTAIYIDPGLGGTGWAQFHNRKLNDYGVIKSGQRGSWMMRAINIQEQMATVMSRHYADTLVIEYPRVWENLQSTVASNRSGDLLKLSSLIGMFITQALKQMPAGIHIKLIPPDEWKGQLPKEVVIRRIKKKLGITPPDHAADAIGMGLMIEGGGL